MTLVTLVTAHILLSAILSFMLYVLHKSIGKHMPGLYWWFLGMALHVGALTLLGLRNRAPALIGFELSTAMFFSASTFLAIGVRRFLGKASRNLLTHAALAASLALYAVFHYLVPSFAARIALFSLYTGGCYVYAGLFILTKQKKPRLSGSRTSGTFFLLAGLTNIARIVVNLALPTGPSYDTNTGNDLFYYYAFIVIHPGIVLSLIQLVNSRLLEENRRMVADKNLLIREMNHRIANSLAMAQGLVNLGDDEASDQCGDDTFERLRGRLHSIALVHRQLYSPAQTQGSGLLGYLTKLLEDLGKCTPGLSIESNLDPIEMPVDSYAPLGIVLNELVTNAAKYGGPGPVRVRVSLKKDGEHAELRVSDSGPGFGDGSPGHVQGTGLGGIIIDSLVMQLDGTWTRGSGSSSLVTVRFPLPKTA